MIQSPNASQRNALYAVSALALVCAAVGIAAWMTSSSPILGLKVAPTPTRERSFAFVEIAKPAAINTISPLDTPAPTILPMASPTAEPLVRAEIVVDTPAPAYSSSAAQNNVSAPSYGGNKHILVDISEQHMYVYEGETLVYSFVSSTGMNNATRAGSFSVLDKIPSAYGATWNIWMPNWLGIYWAGSLENGIHALPILPNGGTLWAGYLGSPISYGCVVLGTDEAKLLYDWADVGTPVEIQR
jgi:lipoprotein-anchoring transpeptidase ErfK/SrfK